MKAIIITYRVQIELRCVASPSHSSHILTHTTPPHHHSLTFTAHRVEWYRVRMGLRWIDHGGSAPRRFACLILGSLDVCECMSVSACVWVHVWVCMCECVCVSACLILGSLRVSACMCVSACTHAYTHTRREPRIRQALTHMHSHIHTYTYTHILDVWLSAETAQLEKRVRNHAHTRTRMHAHT